MVRQAVATPTPTPEPKKPPQGQPSGDLEDRLSQIQTEGEAPQKPAQPQGGLAQKASGIVVSPEKVNLETAALLAFQKALSQAVARNQIRLSEATRIVEDKNIWANLWLGYQMMTGYAEVDPTKLAEGITYYTDAYVVPALQVMPETGIDPKNWSKSLGKAMDVIRDWIDSGARDETGADTPYQEARNASLGYATAQQASDKDKQAYLELLSTLNRQGYVDVYKALDQDFPAIYARWKSLESDFPGLTGKDFSTYLNRYIAPAVGEVDPTQSSAEFLKGVRRNLENLERLDTGRELIPEEGYTIDEDTGEVVPVYPTPKGGWPEPGPTISEQTEAEEAELRRRGYVPYTDEKGTRWLPPPAKGEPDYTQQYITGAGGGVAAGIARERAEAEEFNRRQLYREESIRAAKEQDRRVQKKEGREAARAGAVRAYVGANELAPEATNRDIFQRGMRNVGLMEEAFKGGGYGAYQKELEAERLRNRGISTGYELGEAARALQPAPGYEFGAGRNPVEVSQAIQAAREPWTARRLAEPLAAKFPKEWEEYSQPRIYGWEKGGAHVGAGQFTAEEPFDMPFKDFLTRRFERRAASPAWAQPPEEGEYRAPIANWGFKQPWEGGPAPRGFSQPRPTAGPARMTPIRIGARR